MEFLHRCCYGKLLVTNPFVFFVAALTMPLHFANASYVKQQPVPLFPEHLWNQINSMFYSDTETSIFASIPNLHDLHLAFQYSAPPLFPLLRGACPSPEARALMLCPGVKSHTLYALARTLTYFASEIMSTCQSPGKQKIADQKQLRNCIQFFEAWCVIAFMLHFRDRATVNPSNRAAHIVWYFCRTMYSIASWRLMATRGKQQRANVSKLLLFAIKALRHALLNPLVDDPAPIISFVTDAVRNVLSASPNLDHLYAVLGPKQIYLGITTGERARSVGQLHGEIPRFFDHIHDIFAQGSRSTLGKMNKQIRAFRLVLPWRITSFIYFEAEHHIAAPLEKMSIRMAHGCMNTQHRNKDKLGASTYKTNRRTRPPPKLRSKSVGQGALSNLHDHAQKYAKQVPFAALTAMCQLQVGDAYALLMHQNYKITRKQGPINAAAKSNIGLLLTMLKTPKMFIPWKAIVLCNQRSPSILLKLHSYIDVFDNQKTRLVVSRRISYQLKYWHMPPNSLFACKIQFPPYRDAVTTAIRRSIKNIKDVTIAQWISQRTRIMVVPPPTLKKTYANAAMFLRKPVFSHFYLFISMPSLLRAQVQICAEYE